MINPRALQQKSDATKKVGVDERTVVSLTLLTFAPEPAH